MSTPNVHLTPTEADRIGAMLQTGFALDWFTDSEAHDLTVKLLPIAEGTDNE